MEILSQKQLIRELDKLNQDEFKYIGVWHYRSGYRPEVESHKEFIDNLNVKPIREIKIQDPLTPLQEEISKNAFIIEVSSAYVNIYKVTDLKDKIKGFSKHKCVCKLQWNNNDD